MTLNLKKIEKDFDNIITDIISDNLIKVRAYGDYTITTRIKNYGLYTKKVYSITHTPTSDILYEDIFLFDVARGIVSGLLNSKSIKELINLEEEFASHYLNLLFYKDNYTRAKRKNNQQKMSILSMKFEHSANTMDVIRERIKRLIKRI